MTDEEGRAQMMDDAQGRPPRPALQTPRLPGYSAADLVHIMAGMREHGIARLQVGRLRLELGAQLPSASIANAMRMVGRMGGPVEPAVTGTVQLEPAADSAAPPPASGFSAEDEDEPEDFPTSGPPMGAKVDRKTLAGLDPDDPLLAGTLPSEEAG